MRDWAGVFDLKIVRLYNVDSDTDPRPQMTPHKLSGARATGYIIIADNSCAEDKSGLWSRKALIFPVQPEKKDVKQNSDGLLLRKIQIQERK